MSSPNSEDNTNPPASQPSRPFFEKFRRFSDMQIAALLHSLIGLPSTLTPPNARDFVIEESDITVGTPQPHAASDSNIAEKLRKLPEKNCNNTGGNNGGGSPTTVPQRSSNNTNGDVAESSSARHIIDGGSLLDFLVLPPSRPSPRMSPNLAGHQLAVLMQLEGFRREVGALVLHSQIQGDKVEDLCTTELDAYRLFEALDRCAPLHLTTADARNPAVKSLFPKRRSVTEGDGSNCSSDV